MLYSIGEKTLTMTEEEFDAAIANAIAQEREACALVAESYWGCSKFGCNEEIAAAIRARGSK